MHTTTALITLVSPHKNRERKTACYTFKPNIPPLQSPIRKSKANLNKIVQKDKKGKKRGCKSMQDVEASIWETLSRRENRSGAAFKAQSIRQQSHFQTESFSFSQLFDKLLAPPANPQTIQIKKTTLKERENKLFSCSKKTTRIFYKIKYGKKQADRQLKVSLNLVISSTTSTFT